MYFRFFLSTLLFLVSISFSHAASLYIDPSTGVYGEGNTFSVKVRADTQEECINAIEAHVKYPQDIIKAVDIARGESILTLWPEEPTIDAENGVISFSGGLPGGYCGRIEGDPGFSNVVAELIFRVPGLTIGGDEKPNTGALTFEEGTKVLLNDGFGTPATLFVQDSTFIIGPPSSEGTSDEWFDVIRNDDVRPEAFSVELLRDESVYDGKWFVIFNTRDKQSGIDRYEVYETDIENEGFVRGEEGVESLWKTGSSPYLLEDQTLNSIIRVRALDKAGNERLAGKIPEESLRVHTKAPIDKTLFYVVGGIILLLIIIAILIVLKKRKRRNTSHDTIEHNDEMAPPQGDEPPQI